MLYPNQSVVTFIGLLTYATGACFCCSMSVDIQAGLMYFRLFQSAQLVDAYKEASRIVVSIV